MKFRQVLACLLKRVVPRSTESHFTCVEFLLLLPSTMLLTLGGYWFTFVRWQKRNCGVQVRHWSKDSPSSVQEKLQKNKRTILRRRMKWMDRLALPDRSITWAPQARMQPKRWASIEQGMTVHVHDSIEESTAMPRHSVRCVVTEQRTAEHSPTRAWQQRLGGATTSAVEADSAYERDHSYCGE